MAFAAAMSLAGVLNEIAECGSTASADGAGAVLAGRDPGPLFEDAVEVALVREAEVAGDLGQVTARAEQGPRSDNAFVDLPGDGRKPRHRPEPPHQLKPAELRTARQVRERDLHIRGAETLEDRVDNGQVALIDSGSGDEMSGSGDDIAEDSDE